MVYILARSIDILTFWTMIEGGKGQRDSEKRSLILIRGKEEVFKKKNNNVDI